MQELNLSKIEELQKWLNCQEGLLIDFDYRAALASEQTASNKEERNRREKQGEGSQTADSTHFKPSGTWMVS